MICQSLLTLNDMSICLQSYPSMQLLRENMLLCPNKCFLPLATSALQENKWNQYTTCFKWVTENYLVRASWWYRKYIPINLFNIFLALPIYSPCTVKLGLIFRYQSFFLLHSKISIHQIYHLKYNKIEFRKHKYKLRCLGMCCV